jgi:hypothetical protein
MMHEYPRRPTNSYVDHLQRTVYFLLINKILNFFFVPYSYHVVVLIHLQIGLKHLMVMYLVKYLYHAVINH